MKLTLNSVETVFKLIYMLTEENKHTKDEDEDGCFNIDNLIEFYNNNFDIEPRHFCYLLDEIIKNFVPWSEYSNAYERLQEIMRILQIGDK